MRDLSSQLGNYSNDGTTICDWRPENNSIVRLSSGSDVLLTMACLGIADFFLQYSTINAKSEMRNAINSNSNTQLDIKKMMKGEG